DQAGRVPYLLRAHVRAAQGAEGGALVRRALPLLALVFGLALAPVSAAWAQSAAGAGGATPSAGGRGAGSMTDLGGTQTGSQASGDTELPGGEFALRKSAMVIGQAGPVDPSAYILGPGDVLQLELWGKLTRTVLFEVSPEGKIFLTGAGPLE